MRWVIIGSEVFWAIAVPSVPAESRKTYSSFLFVIINKSVVTNLFIYRCKKTNRDAKKVAASNKYFELYLNMSSYRLDRAAFKAHTAEEAAASQAAYYRSLTWQERLRIANDLNSIAYNYPENEPPKMDKTVFSTRSRK